MRISLIAIAMWLVACGDDDVMSAMDASDARTGDADARADRGADGAIDGAIDGEADAQPDGDRSDATDASDGGMDGAPDAGPSPCDGFVCLHGGTCVESGGMAECSCAAGFAGPRCQRRAAPMIEASTQVTFEVRGDGTMVRFGRTFEAVSSAMPVVVGDGDWDYVSSQGERACAIKRDGTLWCWGDNDHGELGIDSTERALDPMQVGVERDWVDVAISGDVFGHTCGVRADGSLWCWGVNTDGQLGRGETDLTAIDEPQRVDDATDWVQVAVGSAHSCALKRDRTLYCFGRGTNGQLGRGTTADELVPAVLGGTWEEVRAYGVRTCGVSAGGALRCWGVRSDGTAGPTPTPIGSASNWVSVTIGTAVCGVDEDHTAWCFGGNGSGELGVGDHVERTTLTQVGTEEDWRSLSGGRSHTCGMRGDVPYCWGDNQSGQLGLGVRGFKSTPTEIDAATAWSIVDANVSTTCAIDGSSLLHCWGDNQWGQLGDDTRYDVQTSFLVDDTATWLDVASSGLSTCGIRMGGALDCWGCYDQAFLGCTSLYGGRTTGSLPTMVGTAADGWQSLVAGSSTHCGIRMGGALYCWGKNTDGVIGDGSTSDRDDPVLAGAMGVVWSQVDVGGGHACGIHSGGALSCWGRNSVGQLGFAGGATMPMPVGSDTDWTAIATGSYHSCGIRSGTLWCWGEGGSGQLGRGSRTDSGVPIPVGSADDWTHVSAGDDTTCGLRGTGELYCWGAGPIGFEAMTTPMVPMRVGGDADWSSVEVGQDHACGRRGADLYCWGGNAHGEIGDGTAWSEVPVAVVR